MGKWQAGDTLSRTEDRLNGDPGSTGATLTAKTDAAFTSAATGSYTSVAERLSRNTYSGMGSTMVKQSAREKLWKRRKAEKSKSDFPALLGNPAHTAGFPLSHSFGCCCIHDEHLWNKRGHFY